MKLKDGQTVHIGKRKIKGEIPDDLAAKAGLTQTEKPKKDKPAKE